MAEHDAYANHPGEGEAVRKLEESNEERHIEGAIGAIVRAIGNLDDAQRREVLNKALKQVGSSLRARKG